MTNPFLAYAEKAIAAPVRRRMQATEKRRMHKAQAEAVKKVLIERELLMRLWKIWRKETLVAALEGPYTTSIQELIAVLKKLKYKQDAILIPLVKKGPWLTAPLEVRNLVVRLIAARLTQLREAQGLVPFDDPIFTFTPFLTIRRMLLLNNEKLT